MHVLDVTVWQESSLIFLYFDFIGCWPVQGQTPPEADLKEFVAKMKHEWDNCTLEDLESLKGVITRKFFLPEFALLLKQIKEGCVELTWLVATYTICEGITGCH